MYLPEREGNGANHRRASGHAGGVVWFTGLSAAGKSTIAAGVEGLLQARGMRAVVLDGDVLRRGLNADLGYSREDRRENIRRAAEVARLFADAGLIVLAAFITPFEEDRQFVRSCIRDAFYLEVYVKCALEECMRRDPKLLYRRAAKGLVPDFTGFSSPYEEPARPDLVLDTAGAAVEAATATVLERVLCSCAATDGAGAGTR